MPQPKRPLTYLILAGVSFMVAGISFSGLILARDATGQLIFGLTWTVVGIGWLIGAAVRARRSSA